MTDSTDKDPKKVHLIKQAKQASQEQPIEPVAAPQPDQGTEKKKVVVVVKKKVVDCKKGPKQKSYLLQVAPKAALRKKRIKNPQLQLPHRSKRMQNWKLPDQPQNPRLT